MTAAQNTAAWGGQHRFVGFTAAAIAGLTVAVIGVAIAARPLTESSVARIPGQALDAHPAKAADQDASLTVGLEPHPAKAADQDASLTAASEPRPATGGFYLPSPAQTADAAVAITGFDEFNAYLDSLIRKAEAARLAKLAQLQRAAALDPNRFGGPHRG